MSKTLILAASGAALALVAGTFGAQQAFAKDVTLLVDGVPAQVRTNDGTVAEILADRHISLGEHDVVAPAVNTPLADGAEITVRYGRPVTLTLNGATTTRWTTATNVDEALAQFALRADGGVLSVSRSMTISREGAAFSLTLPKHVTITTKAGAKHVAVVGTVADALARAGVKPGRADKVIPAVTTPVTEGLTVKVVAVETKQTTKTVAVPFIRKTEQTATLVKGATALSVVGVDGAVTAIWKQVFEDGKLVSQTRIGTQSTVAPVAEVKLVGTYVAPVVTAPAPAAAPAAAAAPVYSGSHTSWMAAAGIPASAYSYVEVLISRESGWNPAAVNASSGACGLVQALPCSKLGPNWTDPVTALAWGNGYVNARYGGWAGAWAHSQSYGWY